MAQQHILRIALPLPLRRLFDYLPPQTIDSTVLMPGIRVLVPFQSRTLVGILVDKVETSCLPREKLKTALALLDEAPIFSHDIYQLCQWAAHYYHYPLGEILVAALPTLLRKGKSLKAPQPILVTDDQMPIPKELNAAQRAAVAAICAANDHFRVFLLDGVTGSGKTEVYLEAIADSLDQHKQVLVLVPEISLTPQTIARFEARFREPMLALHSGLSASARLQAWLRARSGDVKIVIGTRSAIFTPFANLGLIVVDEEHDASFKQQDHFRYHARDLAIMRANIVQVPIILGSATPSLETLHNVKRHRFTPLSLPERAGNAQLPRYQFVDMRQSSHAEGLSTTLLNAMQDHLAQGNQILLFLNRRGFAPVLYCSSCAWVADCHRCDARMIYHHTPLHLRCHHCDSCASLPTHCDQCGNATLRPIGLGTQRLERTLTQFFPDTPIIRLDRDNTKCKGAMQNLLGQVNENKKAILLGTQMLAKGHHFPHVTLVGIVEADHGLFSLDFRAAEQMGQLILQVAGRAGREEKPGTVLIQTRHPDHPLLRRLIQEGYPAFSTALLNEREMASLPPFSYFAVFHAESYSEQSAIHFLTSIKKIGAAFHPTVTLLGPTPALLAKKRGRYSQRLLIKSNQRRSLQNALKSILEKIEKLAEKQSVKWIVDVDPIEVG